VSAGAAGVLQLYSGAPPIGLAFSIEMENELMTAILDKGMDGETAAREWLKRNPQVLEPWLQGVVTLDGQPAEPAVRSSLGI
jgi:glycine betaine/proline transport system substrate-binding protein